MAFRPGAGEERDDGDMAFKKGGCGNWGAGGEGLPVQVGEVERPWAAKEGGGCEEGFAFCVLEGGPFAEVGGRYLFCANVAVSG